LLTIKPACPLFPLREQKINTLKKEGTSPSTTYLGILTSLSFVRYPPHPALSHKGRGNRCSLSHKGRGGEKVRILSIRKNNIMEKSLIFG